MDACVLTQFGAHTLARPCQRCVKKGLEATCTDGARKKAKYLLDETELAEMKREKETKHQVKAEGSTEEEEIGSVSALQARRELEDTGDWRESSTSFDTGE